MIPIKKTSEGSMLVENTTREAAISIFIMKVIKTIERGVCLMSAYILCKAIDRMLSRGLLERIKKMYFSFNYF